MAESVAAVSLLINLAASLLTPIQRSKWEAKGIRSLQIQLCALSEVLNALLPLVENPPGGRIIIPQDLCDSCLSTLRETERLTLWIAQKGNSPLNVFRFRTLYGERLEQLKKDMERDKSTFSIILASITTFLWVALVIKNLARAKSPKAIQHALQTTPLSLYDLYEGILLDILKSDDHAGAVFLFLQTLASAREPIALSALSHTSFLKSVFDLEEDTNQEEKIQESCRGLVTVNNFVIQLVHPTVKELLLEKDTMRRLIGVEAKDDYEQLSNVMKQLGVEQSFSSKKKLSSQAFVGDKSNLSSDSESLRSWSSSIFSDISDTSSQTSIMSQLKSVTHQYAHLFASNEESLPLILECLEKLGVTGFEHEFAELLVAYSSDLRRLASTGSQQVAAIMAGQKTFTIARQTVIMSGFLDTHQIESRIVKQVGTPGNDATVDRILGLHDRFKSSMITRTAWSERDDVDSNVTALGLENMNSEVLELNQPSENLSPLDGIDDLNDEYSQIYQNLDSVKNFLIYTEAFGEPLLRLKSLLEPPTFKSPELQRKISRNADKKSRWTLSTFQQGMKRVHWTCEGLTCWQVCGGQMYDDFTEVVPGAADKMQRDLVNIYMSSHPPDSHSLVSTNPTFKDKRSMKDILSAVRQLLGQKFLPASKSEETNLYSDDAFLQLSSSREIDSIEQGNDFIRDRAAQRQHRTVPATRNLKENHDGEESSLQKAPGTNPETRQQDSAVDAPPQSSRPTQGQNENAPSPQGEVAAETSKSEQLPETNDCALWVLPCFRIARTGHVAQHISVNEGTYDFDIFSKFRYKYFRQRNWFRRFMELKEVTKLDFVQVKGSIEFQAKNLTDCVLSFT
ncbi:MAG: hypothetical protein Q9160_007658 [Pyrenula sp. 1 TL-2023]